MQKRNILLIGRTGSGKSTMANVLINKDGDFREIFEESDKSISETKYFQVEEFESDGTNYQIIDTIGLGDTSLVVTKIPPIMKKLTEHTSNGLDQILYVVDKRFTKEDTEVFEYLRWEFFDESVVNHISIIRTNFSNFRNKKKCDEDIRDLCEEKNKEINKIISLCGQRIIHVDNPPINIVSEENEGNDEIVRVQISLNKKVRENSRKIILNHLNNFCQNKEVYKPLMGELSEKIRKKNEEDLKRLHREKQKSYEDLKRTRDFTRWRWKMEKDIKKYKDDLIWYVEKCEIAASVGKNFSLVMKNAAMPISLVFGNTVPYAPLVSITLVLGGQVTELGSEITKLITQNVYYEMIKDKIKEDKNIRNFLREESKKQIKDFDFSFFELSWGAIRELLAKKLPYLKNETEKILKAFKELSEKNKNDLPADLQADQEDTVFKNLEELGKDGKDLSSELKGILSSVIKEQIDNFLDQLENELVLLNDDYDEIENEYREKQKLYNDLEKTLREENLHLEAELIKYKNKIEVPPKN